MINSINKVSSWMRDGNKLVDTNNTALTITNLNLGNDIDDGWRYNNLIRIECEGRTYICDAAMLLIRIFQEEELIEKRLFNSSQKLHFLR